MKKITYNCDIKNCNNKVEIEENIQKNIQIIFLTEQTEGRGSDPYLDNKKLDICEKCMNKILKGEAIYGQGAQGHNNYNFKEKES